jgi:drug/metabolite transporter (DMT)-like permease
MEDGKCSIPAMPPARDEASNTDAERRLLQVSASTPRCLSRQLASGMVIVCIMAASQTLSSELTSAGLEHLNAPFFTMWLHTAFMVFVFPISLGIQALKTRQCRSASSVWRLEISTPLVPSRVLVQPPCIPPLAWLAMQFYLWWVAANYLYARALVEASPSLVTATFSSCSAFVAVFSRLWLQEPMTLGKVTSVTLAVGGVFVLGMSKHSSVQGSNPPLGVLFALFSSVSAAIYKVAFKVYFPGEMSMQRLSVFLSLIGIVNLAFGTLPGVALGWYGVEESAWHPSPPIGSCTWLAIIGGCVRTCPPRTYLVDYGRIG